MLAIYGARRYNIHMKSLNNKDKFDAMKFARDNDKIECVLYAKAGVLDNVPTVMMQGSYAELEAYTIDMRLNPNHFRKSYSIVTKSFYDKVIHPSWLLNNRDTDFNKINTI